MRSESGAILLLFALIAVFFFLIVGRAAIFFRRFNEDKGYLKSEIRRAQSIAERRHWKRELRCHYLCLLPFVNEKNVSGIYRVFFHKPRHAKENESGIYRVLVISFIGMGICAVSLCGATWAWFTATTSAGTAVIQAASYTVTVTAESGGENLDIAVNDGVSTAGLEPDKEYTVTLTPGGTATAGYCKITLGGKEYYTAPLTTGEPFTFKVKTTKEQDLTVTPQWGSYAGEATVSDGATLEISE